MSQLIAWENIDVTRWNFTSTLPTPLALERFLFAPIIRRPQISWPTEIGATYRIETSPNLEDWNPLELSFPEGGSDGGIIDYSGDIVPADVMERFFRVRQNR